jgi:hypothetical protein
MGQSARNPLGCCFQSGSDRAKLTILTRIFHPDGEGLQRLIRLRCGRSDMVAVNRYHSAFGASLIGPTGRMFHTSRYAMLGLILISCAV